MGFNKFILCLFFVFIRLNGFGQACPACSNPALQSSEKLESGLDTLLRGTWRFTINATNGLNYQGGHPNYRGLSEEGNIVQVPLHHHQVSLDFLRTEMSVEYTFATNFSVWFRLPYDMKVQEATISYPEPVSPSDQLDILRNRDIHHRNEAYDGISDLKLLMAYRINGFLQGRLDVALGASVPVGKTEEDPLIAGENGQEHLHIQFGTGTFDPLLELHYATELSEKLSFALFTINRMSFYTNKNNYRGPVESTSGVSLSYKPRPWLLPRLTLANFTQSQAKWNGKEDPNSGLTAYNITANVTFHTEKGVAITPGYRYPLAQKALSNEGDTFEYGSTFLLNVSYLLNNPK